MKKKTAIRMATKMNKDMYRTFTNNQMLAPCRYYLRNTYAYLKFFSTSLYIRFFARNYHAPILLILVS